MALAQVSPTATWPAGNLYLVQLTTFKLPEGCPSKQISSLCNTSTPAMPVCFPSCSSNQVCIVDNGYGCCYTCTSPLSLSFSLFNITLPQPWHLN